MFKDPMGKMTTTKRLAFSGVLIALGVVLSTFSIPFAGSKCFPIQHLINVIGGVLLGPLNAVVNAFVISLLRNMTGLGSPLAFPGSMIGAFLSGFVFIRTGNYRMACVGEVFGTGVLGGLIASPMAIYLMGREVGLFVFILPFVLSSFMGAGIAWLLLESTQLIKILAKGQVH